MTGRFLIVGLPRSRLAWLSVAATGDGSICYHEPLKYMEDWRDIGSIWDAQYYRHAGIADGALGFHLPEIIDRWAPKILIVERLLAEVEGSADRLYPDLPKTNYCHLLEKIYQKQNTHLS